MIIGVTGGFSSGKSTVAGFLAERGAMVLDADAIAHQMMEPGENCYQAVVELFGDSILGEGQRIDRQFLGKIVFSDFKKLQRLNQIIHPYVKQKFKEAAARILMENPRSLIVFDVPLLVESGMTGDVDWMVVVTTTVKKQIERAMERFGLAEREALRRIQAQIPLREKARRADFVISTSGTLDETKKQVEKLCQKLNQ
jgi:dephospho-CoA kinase